MKEIKNIREIKSKIGNIKEIKKEENNSKNKNKINKSLNLGLNRPGSFDNFREFIKSNNKTAPKFIVEDGIENKIKIIEKPLEDEKQERVKEEESRDFYKSSKSADKRNYTPTDNADRLPAMGRVGEDNSNGARYRMEDPNASGVHKWDSPQDEIRYHNVEKKSEGGERRRKMPWER